MRFRRALLASGLVAVAAVAGLLSLHAYARAHPDWAYRQVTGRELPAEVQALDYNWTLNDNLLHVGHYWLLRGSESQLRAFAQQADLAESTEDSKWTVPDLAHLFGPADRRSVRVGFEGDQPRNNWLWIFDDGSTAAYEFN